jgi:hypothetical protein
MTWQEEIRTIWDEQARIILGAHERGIDIDTIALVLDLSRNTIARTIRAAKPS